VSTAIWVFTSAKFKITAIRPTPSTKSHFFVELDCCRHYFEKTAHWRKLLILHLSVDLGSRVHCRILYIVISIVHHSLHFAAAKPPSRSITESQLPIALRQHIGGGTGQRRRDRVDRGERGRGRGGESARVVAMLSIIIATDAFSCRTPSRLSEVSTEWPLSGQCPPSEMSDHLIVTCLDIRNIVIPVCLPGSHNVALSLTVSLGCSLKRLLNNRLIDY